VLALVSRFYKPHARASCVRHGGAARTAVHACTTVTRGGVSPSNGALCTCVLPGWYSLSLSLFASVLCTRRQSYATKSNKVRRVKTPGGKLVLQVVPKKTKGPQTPATDLGTIQGVPHLRNSKYANKVMSKNKKSVSRAYGGVLSAKMVRERVIRAFLVEEQKIVKKVLKSQAGKA